MKSCATIFVLGLFVGNYVTSNEPDNCMHTGLLSGIACTIGIWMLGGVLLGVKSVVELPDKTEWIVPDESPKKTLLRPSALRDTSPDTLLRPAAHSPNASPKELLRASEKSEKQAE